MPARPIRIILFGLGPVGSEIARVLVRRPGIQIVGAVEIDRAKAGRDLGQVIGLRESLHIPISADAKSVLKKRADVVVHATGSYLSQVMPQFEMILSAQHSIVSTCEELAEPYAQNTVLARRLDALARERGVAIVGTGVNPGYTMDALPVMLTALCQTVKKVRVLRVVDASHRRIQLQRKIGTGLTAAEFRERAARREIRHVGLLESVYLIARGLGWALAVAGETIEPVLASRAVRTDHYDVPPNFVTGVHQTAFGEMNGERVIELELRMSVDAEGTRDEVWIEGIPPIHSRVEGIHGDLSTAAIVANTVRRIVGSAPGLYTMVDLPLLAAR